jgi:hypothetical protein
MCAEARGLHLRLFFDDDEEEEALAICDPDAVGLRRASK